MKEATVRDRALITDLLSNFLFEDEEIYLSLF